MSRESGSTINGTHKILKTEHIVLQLGFAEKINHVTFFMEEQHFIHKQQTNII